MFQAEFHPSPSLSLSLWLVKVVFFLSFVFVLSFPSESGGKKPRSHPPPPPSLDAMREVGKKRRRKYSKSYMKSVESSSEIISSI
jgi:hypothetical protein